MNNRALLTIATLLAVMIAAPATSQTATGPTTPTAQPARPLGSPAGWIGLEDYPAQAYAEQREGAVRVRLSIAPLGFVDGCTVVESSGSADLDAGTCRILMVRGFFTPARDATGQAIAGEYVRRIRWQHPALHPAAPASAPSEVVPPPVSPQ